MLNNQLCEQIYATHHYKLNSHDGLKCLKVIDGNLHEVNILMDFREVSEIILSVKSFN